MKRKIILIDAAIFRMKKKKRIDSREDFNFLYVAGIPNIVLIMMMMKGRHA